MKKLSNILKWSCILLFLRIIYLIYLQVINLVLIYRNKKVNHNILSIELPENINQFWLTIINSTTLLLFVYISFQIFKLIKIAKNLHQNLLFTSKNAVQLKQVAISIIVFTSSLVIIETPLKYFELIKINNLLETKAYYKGNALGHQIAEKLYLFVVAFFILIISSLIKKGEIIKQENDLTI